MVYEFGRCWYRLKTEYHYYLIITFAIPSPNIPSPIIIPMIGPGNTITAKKSVFLTPAIIPVTPAAINCHSQ